MSRKHQPPEFASEEARLAVVDTNSRAYLTHAHAARGHEQTAAQIRGELARTVEQIKALQGRAAELERAAADADHRAAAEQSIADGYARLLTSIGAQVPQLPPEQPPGAQVWPAPTDGTQPLQPIEAQVRDGLTRAMDVPPGVDPLQQRVDRLMEAHPGEPPNPVWDDVEAREGGS